MGPLNRPLVTFVVGVALAFFLEGAEGSSGSSFSALRFLEPFFGGERKGLDAGREGEG